MTRKIIKVILARKIIIDTDPGVDDAMAIFYALAAPELDVIGITTVFGNTHTHICTTNALRLLEIAGRTDIPVAGGAVRPLAMPYNGTADIVHGADGQANVNLPEPTTNPVAQHAVQFLIETIQKSPEPVTIVALGPLTNIGLLLLTQPDIVKNIREIVLMGGNAYVPGNVTPAAEANIWNDPDAADIVFGAECPVTMIGLDVTEKVFMTAEVLDSIGQIDNRQARHLAKILPFYRGFYLERYGRDGIHVHDSTTITWLLAPELFRTVQLPVRVETMGMSKGKTWPAEGFSDFEAAWQNRSKVNIAVEVDGAKAVALELGRLAQIPNRPD